MRASREATGDDIEVLPVVVVTRAFQARPSSVPDIRDFVRQQLAGTTLSSEHVRTLGHRVADVLLEAAGAGGTIKVSLRIFADHAEVDLLQDNGADVYRSDGGSTVLTAREAATWAARNGAAGPGSTRGPTLGNGLESAATPASTGWATDRPGISFATWLAEALRREGMTMEAASRRLRVSVKTVSRWIGGTTEPRLRDLSRIREVFGDLPPP
jgi:hypothetical protein